MDVLLTTIIDTIPSPYSAEVAAKAETEPFKMEVNSIQVRTPSNLSTCRRVSRASAFRRAQARLRS
jgi:hypothetical protein